MIRPDDLVDPELRAALALLPDLSGLSHLTLGEVRARLAGAPPRPSSDKLEVEEIRITAAAGQSDVGGLLYRPTGAGTRPAILNLHGGGFVAGDARREDESMRKLALALDAVILSLDYRLAPETPFPGALDDGYAALGWLHDHSDRLEIDPSRIALRGVSAGGGIAAGLALLARDRGGPGIAFMLLIYPMLDDRTGPHAFAGRYVWPIEANRFGWDCYLGDAAGTDAVSYYAAPARAQDLAGMPASFIAIGAIDLFIDEDLRFAQALIGAGVVTELHVYPGAYHGFPLITGAGVAARLERDASEALSRALAPPSA